MMPEYLPPDTLKRLQNEQLGLLLKLLDVSLTEEEEAELERLDAILEAQYDVILSILEAMERMLDA
jgi:hypothetical protein